MSARAKVLIVDDHPLVREALAARISSQADLEVAGQAGDIDEAWAEVRASAPALVILDLALKNSSGMDLIKRIRSAEVATKILVVSAYDESLFAERALRAGANGYINKQELQGSVLDAIRTVLRGGLYLSGAMAQRLAGEALSRRKGATGTAALTDRELEIFRLIGSGRGTREIAEQLHLSVHTIESHREKIRLKLHLRNGTELMQHAVKWLVEQGQ